MYGEMTYSGRMETKASRWTLRVTPAQDAAVKRVLATTGESLNEYVVRHAVAAAHDDLADRWVFGLGEAAWNELQAILDRPPVAKVEVTRLLGQPSVLEQTEP